MLRCAAAAFIAVVLLLVFSCGGAPRSALDRAAPETRELEELNALLADPGHEGEDRFAVVQAIVDVHLRTRDFGPLIAFLTGIVEKDPVDPYAAHYLFTVAWAYLQMGAREVAALYFDRIVKNHPDLILGGESIHRISLEQLLELAPSPERRIDYRRELIARFPDSIDIGAAWFLLGKEYERVGDWESAMAAYKKYLPYFGSPVPGYPDAFQYARLLIELASSSKDWTFASLDGLVQQVRAALAAGSPRAVERLRARVGFFAMSWQQNQTEGNSEVLFEFSDFMMDSRIVTASTLDPRSNAREAFLRTWGWSERITTWYFYFRKINFPPDPEIHGRWEWAGIFFGEKLN
ncbi:MAG TPA: tetratricopeptide repeat protein [Magnetospirillaceae bacterium]|nr:tetratricopeptide repeat protein [Magnetospirillaceae bacterium]